MSPANERRWAEREGALTCVSGVRPSFLGMAYCPTPSKARFRSRTKALFTLAMIRSKGEARAYEVRGTYECACGAWHLTHKKGMAAGVRLNKGAPVSSLASGERYHVSANRMAHGWLLQCREVPDAVLRIDDLSEAREIAGVIAWVLGVPDTLVRLRVEVE
jgi:hypothetical protein